MKLYIACVLLLFSEVTVFSQKGEVFPELSGKTLESRKISLPTDTKGKFTLIGIAYSKKAEEQLNTWMEPVYLTFIHKPEKPSMFYNQYDVNLFFIPMFTGVNTTLEGPARKKMEKTIDPRLHPYVLFYKGALKPYKEKLAFEEKDTPYFFVLDGDGKIIYATSGSCTEEKLEEIEEHLE